MKTCLSIRQIKMINSIRFKSAKYEHMIKGALLRHEVFVICLKFINLNFAVFHRVLSKFIDRLFAGYQILIEIC